MVSHVVDGQLRSQGVHKAFHQLVWCGWNGPRCGLIFGTLPPTPPSGVEISESQQTGEAPYKHPHSSSLLVLLQTPLKPFCAWIPSQELWEWLCCYCAHRADYGLHGLSFFRSVFCHLLLFVMHLGRCSLI